MYYKLWKWCAYKGVWNANEWKKSKQCVVQCAGIRFYKSKWIQRCTCQTYAPLALHLRYRMRGRTSISMSQTQINYGISIVLLCDRAHFPWIKWRGLVRLMLMLLFLPRPIVIWSDYCLLPPAFSQYCRYSIPFYLNRMKIRWSNFHFFVFFVFTEKIIIISIVGVFIFIGNRRVVSVLDYSLCVCGCIYRVVWRNGIVRCAYNVMNERK